MQASSPPTAASAAELVAQFEKTKGLNDRIGILRQLAIVGRDESVPLIEKLFDHEDPVIRQYALSAAESNPSPAAGAALVKAVAKARDADWKVAVIDALGGRREKTAAGPLGGLIADPDPDVSAAAIAALGTIGTSQAMGALIAAGNRFGTRAKAGQSAENKDETQRLTVQIAMAMMLCRDRMLASGELQGSPDRGMSFAITDTQVPAYLRLAAVRGLAKVGDLSKAFGFAVASLKNGSVREQAEAARILIDLEDEDRVIGPSHPQYRFVNVQQKLLAALPTLPPTAQGFLLEALAEREAKMAMNTKESP